MARAIVESRLRMSYDEYYDWVDSHTHSEWVDGEVTVFMPPIPRHALIVNFLSTLLRFFVDIGQVGQIVSAPFEMKLRAGRSYREPDLLFVKTENLDRIDAKRLTGPADLAIEVLSEDDPNRDRVEKFAEYQDAGIPEYWIVEGREGRAGVEFYRLGLDGRYVLVTMAADGRFYSDVVSGFWLDPAWLAADPLPSVVDCLRAIVPNAFAAIHGNSQEKT